MQIEMFLSAVTVRNFHYSKGFCTIYNTFFISVAINPDSRLAINFCFIDDSSTVDIQHTGRHRCSSLSTSAALTNFNASESISGNINRAFEIQRSTIYNNTCVTAGQRSILQSMFTSIELDSVRRLPFGVISSADDINILNSRISSKSINLTRFSLCNLVISTVKCYTMIELNFSSL